MNKHLMSFFLDSGASYDSDAQAFFTATGITDATQKTAVNTLVTALKAASIWTKYVAIYPFVGGAATTHKFNLKDPQDTDAAYRLTFSGGWTHNANGVTGNGTTGAARTYVILPTLGRNTAGFTIVSKTAAQAASYGWGVIDGSFALRSALRWTDDNAYTSISGGADVSAANTDGSGFFLGTRISLTQFNLYIRGTKSTLSRNSLDISTSTVDIALGAEQTTIGSFTSFSSRNWASFGLMNATFSDADELAARNAFTAFNTALSR